VPGGAEAGLSRRHFPGSSAPAAASFRTVARRIAAGRREPSKQEPEETPMHRRPILASLAGLPLLPAASLAQTASPPSWTPSRPVRFVVGFAPGGSTDTAARILAEALGGPLGQPVVVENRVGAAGNIGSEHVARSAPDGYTYVVASIGTHATNQFLYPDMGFDVVRDFSPVSLTLLNACVVVAHPATPYRTVAELIAHARAHPGKVNLGTAGPGSSQHFGAALFEQQAGVKFTHVPYRGGAPAIADLIGGRIDLVFSPIVEALAFVQGGQLRPLGVTRADASPSLPGVPPVGVALPGYVFNTWQGLFAPARTPAPVVAGMAAAVAAVLRQPATRSRLEQLGYQPVGSTPEDFATFQLAELEKVRDLVRLSGATAQ
jgi:tripartite-type tricarboxylate transporter receptor subunit TctC